MRRTRLRIERYDTSKHIFCLAQLTALHCLQSFGEECRGVGTGGGVILQQKEHLFSVCTEGLMTNCAKSPAMSDNQQTG
jgi:hypothetical protein